MHAILEKVRLRWLRVHARPYISKFRWHYQLRSGDSRSLLESQQADRSRQISGSFLQPSWVRLLYACMLSCSLLHSMLTKPQIPQIWQDYMTNDSGMTLAARRVSIAAVVREKRAAARKSAKRKKGSKGKAPQAHVGTLPPTSKKSQGKAPQARVDTPVPTSMRRSQRIRQPTKRAQVCMDWLTLALSAHTWLLGN